MKLVRENINEKFADKSDPVHDMGIGKINLLEKYHDIMDAAIAKWEKFVAQFIGQTISGKMTDYTNNTYGKTKEYIFKITGFWVSSDITFLMGEGDTQYRLLENEEYIIE